MLRFPDYLVIGLEVLVNKSTIRQRRTGGRVAGWPEATPGKPTRRCRRLDIAVEVLFSSEPARTSERGIRKGQVPRIQRRLAAAASHRRLQPAGPV